MSSTHNRRAAKHGAPNEKRPAKPDAAASPAPEGVERTASLDEAWQPAEPTHPEKPTQPAEAEEPKETTQPADGDGRPSDEASQLVEETVQPAEKASQPAEESDTPTPDAAHADAGEDEEEIDWGEDGHEDGEASGDAAGRGGRPEGELAEDDDEFESRPAGERLRFALFAAAGALVVVLVAVLLVQVLGRLDNGRSGVELTEPSEVTTSSTSSDESAPADDEQVDTTVPYAAPSAATSQLKTSIEAATAGMDGVSVTYMVAGSPSDGFSINGDVSHVSASMIKLAILADLCAQADAGVVSLDQTVELTADDIVGGSGVLQGAEVGTSFALRDLALHMIADSDNIAANMLIDVLGMDNINANAQALGLTGTSLQRRMMDTDAQAAGYENYMSADDAASLLQRIASGTLVNAEYSTFALSLLEQQTVDSGLAAGVEAAGGAGVTVAHKTGELVNVEHDGGIVYATTPYVLVMMTEGVSNGTAMELIKAISQQTYAASLGIDPSSTAGVATIVAQAQAAQTEAAQAQATAAIVASEEEANALTGQDAGATPAAGAGAGAGDAGAAGAGAGAGYAGAGYGGADFGGADGGDYGDGGDAYGGDVYDGDGGDAAPTYAGAGAGGDGVIAGDAGGNAGAAYGDPGVGAGAGAAAGDGAGTGDAGAAGDDSATVTA